MLFVMLYWMTCSQSPSEPFFYYGSDDLVWRGLLSPSIPPSSQTTSARRGKFQPCETLLDMSSGRSSCD